MRRCWRAWLEETRLRLSVAGLLLLMPALFPIAMIQHGRARRRQRQRAEQSPCVRCGAVLGRAALERSDAEAAAHGAEMRRQHPNWRFRIVRRTHAICVRCGQEYRYDELRNAFLPLGTIG